MQAGGLGRSSAEENKMMSERDLEEKGKRVGIRGAKKENKMLPLTH